MKRQLALGVAVLAGTLAFGPVIHAEATPDNGRRLQDHQESGFLRQRAQNDVFEWRLGEYAERHAQSDQVRQLGRQMVADHRADLRQLQALADQHKVNLTVPKGLTPQQQEVYDRITQQKDINFDKAYTKLMVSDHTDALGQAKRERDHAQDSAVKDYAAGIVHTLEDHLRMSHSAEKAVWGM